MSFNIEDLHCLGNHSDPTFIYYANISQTVVPWVDQSKYALYTLYYGVALVGVFMIKNIAFYLLDKLQLSGFIFDFYWKLVAISRSIAYRKVPLTVASALGMPTSFGTLLVLFCSALYGFCYLFIPHYWYRQCADFGSPPLAVRAGLMAIALTPFIYILAGKTNVISQLTGISYERLMVYHQGVAWLTLVFGLVHTFGFVYGQQLNGGGWAHLKMKFQTQSIYQNGIPPLLCLFLLCFLSLPYIRRRFYEVFLHLHWPLGIGYFATLVVHSGNYLKSNNYMWGAVAFWASQLVYRALVKTSFRPRMSTFIAPNQSYLRRLDGDSEMFEVLIKNEHMKWSPGQHIFIRFDRVRVLDNHPFTIASSYVENGVNNIRLLIKPCDGITRLIYNKLTTEQIQGDVSMFENIYIDGPYGGMPRDIGIFDNVVLVANGSGVTQILSILTYIVRAKNTNIKKVNFIWVVRNANDVSWCQEELEFAIYMAKESGLKLNIDIYAANGLKEKKTEGIDVHNGKPSIKNVITEKYPTELMAKNAFVVCGSNSLQYSVGQEVAKLQKTAVTGSVQEIYLHTEHFGW